MLTIVLSKNSRGHLNHGLKNECGGYGGTSNCGWSYRQGEAYELARIPNGAEYQVAINGRITKTGIKT